MSRMTRISGGTKTVASNTDVAVSQSFHPGWDKEKGLAQANSHIRKRASEGKKMTPKGTGVLRRK